MRIWDIYRAPTWSEAPILVQEWQGRHGAPVEDGDPIPAADLEAARKLIPHGPGLERQPRRKAKNEAEGLIETWILHGGRAK